MKKIKDKKNAVPPFRTSAAPLFCLDKKKGFPGPLLFLVKNKNKKLPPHPKFFEQHVAREFYAAYCYMLLSITGRNREVLIDIRFQSDGRSLQGELPIFLKANVHLGSHSERRPEKRPPSHRECMGALRCDC